MQPWQWRNATSNNNLTSTITRQHPQQQHDNAPDNACLQRQDLNNNTTLTTTGQRLLQRNLDNNLKLLLMKTQPRWQRHLDHNAMTPPTTQPQRRQTMMWLDCCCITLSGGARHWLGRWTVERNVDWGVMSVRGCSVRLLLLDQLKPDWHAYSLYEACDLPFRWWRCKRWIGGWPRNFALSRGKLYALWNGRKMVDNDALRT